MSKIKDKPVIGKAAIESLTTAMYDAPYFIYREYVQNGADSIDHAVQQDILKNREEGRVNIWINSEKRQIVIEDNGIGIESKLVRGYLGNIAQSTKNKYQDKGFRGIGRLGGLGYCDKLTYETSSKGEGIKSIMTWDAKNLRSILNTPERKRDASEVVSIVTDFKRTQDSQESHYMRITLEGVSNDDLLNLSKVKSYLSMVAPLPFAPNFSFAQQIYKRAKNEKVKIDEYLVYLNNDPLFKGYKDDILKAYKRNEEEILEKYDVVYDIKYFKALYEKDLLFWGWYGITKNMKYIPEINTEKYIRLRKNNIQIGLKSRLDEFHKKESGSQYFIGEVYATHKELHPNARRDFFIENPVLTAFTENIKILFENLHELFYDFSKKNSAFSIINGAKQAKQKLDHELSQKPESSKINDFKSDYKRKSEKVLNAQESLVDLYYKHEKDALGNIISESIPIKELEREIQNMRRAVGKEAKTTIEDKLGLEEQKLLAFVIGVIRATYAKKTSEKLITKIRREIQNNYE